VTLVIARLIGGLGNQMFQYAAGRALALRRGADLKLDLSGFESYSRRRYELDTLPICAAAATGAELAEFGVHKRRSVLIDRIRRKLRLRVGSAARPVYREPHFHFDPAMLALGAPVYLDGFWQSERYFLDCSDIIRRELTATDTFDHENAVVAAQIDAVNAVSLHVRRGDYVSDATTNRYHGICAPQYYQNALEYIVARTERPHLFVFSDDPEWTQCNLRFPVPTTFVVANSAERGQSDMALMSRCRHHILANSSFSWWGAWLNPSHEKIVVAPRRWFNAGTPDGRDLVPQAWVRL
jgi:Glycosyl transferase family 11